MHHPIHRITHTVVEWEIAQWVYHEGTIWQPIAPWANALTMELHLTPGYRGTVTLVLKQLPSYYCPSIYFINGQAMLFNTEDDLKEHTLVWKQLLSFYCLYRYIFLQMAKSSYIILKMINIRLTNCMFGYNHQLESSDQPLVTNHPWPVQTSIRSYEGHTDTDHS